MSRGSSPVSPEEVTGVPQGPTAGREHLQLHTNAGKGGEVRAAGVCGGGSRHHPAGRKDKARQSRPLDRRALRPAALNSMGRRESRQLDSELLGLQRAAQCRGKGQYCAPPSPCPAATNNAQPRRLRTSSQSLGVCRVGKRLESC